jgi:thiol-disulfide isomerase/thioredoxin
MVSLKGLIGVVVTAFLLSIPLYFYWEFLTRGMRPSPSTLRLNQIEQDGVPDFTLKDLSGRSVSLSQYKGTPVVVNLWATWCAPCVKEFPSLKGLVEHFKGKLIVLAISHDKSREDLDSFIAAFGAVPPEFVILWDEKRETGALFGTDQLPETYILSKEHKLVRKVAGEQRWDDPMALQFFVDMLGI